MLYEIKSYNSLNFFSIFPNKNFRSKDIIGFFALDFLVDNYAPSQEAFIRGGL